MFQRFIFIICLTFLYFCFGCKTQDTYSNSSVINPGALSTPLTKIEDITRTFTGNNIQIKDISSEIVRTAEKIIPREKSAISIKSGAEKISYINEENKKNTEGLVVVKEQITKASGEIEILKKENIELNDSITKEYKKIWMIICSIGAIGFIASLFLTIGYSPKIGLPLMIGSIATVAVSYFMAAYAWLVAIIGGVIALGILGFFVYQAIIERKALKESILSMEASKYKVWNEDVRKEVQNLQSDETQSLVRSIKKDIKKITVFDKNINK